MIAAVYSCNKSNDSKTSHTVTLFGNTYEVLTLTENNVKVKNHSSSANKTTSSSWGTIYTQYIVMNSTNMQNLLATIDDSLNGDIRHDTLPATIILYLSQNSTTLNYANVYGVSIFNPKYNGSELREFYHMYYATPNKSSTNVSRTNTNCTNFSSKDFEMLLGYSLEDVTTDAPKIIQIDLNTITNVFPTASYKPLGRKLYDENFSMRPSGGCGSGPACASGEGSCAREGCGGCAVTDGNTALIAANRSDSLLSEKTGDNFRDSFLVNYDIGVKYIYYYYMISYVHQIFGLNGGSHLSNNLAFAWKSYNVANILKSGTNTTVVIDTPYYNMAMNMITVDREVVHNDDYNDLLDDIVTDLNFYRNKTRRQILDAIE